jgi:pyruvate formate lyase activating enzyme
MADQKIGLIADIQHCTMQDGPGIRTTVFLKGCPLRCQWCHNPEMVNQHKEVWYIETKCTFCGKCIEVCPEGAIIETNDEKEIDRDACVINKGCQKCVEVCPGSALVVVGAEMPVEDAVKEVRKDEIFYHRGGGVCLSGGEPTMQPDFSKEFLKQCQSHAIHTALVTSCYAKWDILSSVVQYADLVLTDIKHMDPVKHKEGTGVSNELILENITKLAKMGKDIKIRLPLLPGYNDSKENLRKTAEFMETNKLKYIDLVPFHMYSKWKYKRFGKKYACYWIKEPSVDEMTKLKTLFKLYGLEANIGAQNILPS